MHQTFVWIIICLTISVVNTQTCKESPKTVCSHPKPTAIDYDWFVANEPADGWHMELGNAAVRLHLAELIQGKLLSYKDDFSKMCGRIRSAHSDVSSADEKLYGFDGKKASFVCNISVTEGAEECEYSNIGLSKYADSSINYLTFSDNKNVIVGIFCFPNGENGWFSMSKTTSLTEVEKKTVLEHVKSIGYDEGDVVTMYNDACSDNNVDDSFIVRQQVRPNFRHFHHRQRQRSRSYRQYEI